MKNKSKATVQLVGLATVTYGPDGEKAEPSYMEKTDIMDGKLIPGKSRSTSLAFLIPPKYYGDVVMEVSVDREHESAVFSGSIK